MLLYAVGLGASSDAVARGGWSTPNRNLTQEWTKANGAPTKEQADWLARLAKRNNDIFLRGNIIGGKPSRNDERDFNTAQNLISFYIRNRRGPDNGPPTEGKLGQPETTALINQSSSAVKPSSGFFSDIVKAVTSVPLSIVVNPADAIVHKVVGDKTYYAVANAVGGSKVENALRAGNDISSHSISDLSKGSTASELASQGVKIAAIAIDHKLSSNQVEEVLKALHPASASAAVAALSKTAPAIVPPQMKILEPPKRAGAPTAAPAAPARPTILEPPKRGAAPPTSTSASTSSYGPYPHGASGGVHGLGFTWGSNAWRWFVVYSDGRAIAQRGPVWLSDNEAATEAASFLESTQGRNYIGTVSRWDWDPNGHQWRRGIS